MELEPATSEKTSVRSTSELGFSGAHNPVDSHERHWKRIGLVALVYFVSILLSRFFALRPEILAPIWIPAGILLAGLLWLPWSALLPAAGAAFLASLAGNLVAHVPLVPGITFSLANCISGLLGAVVLKRLLKPEIRIGELRGLVYLMVFGAVLTNGFGAAIGASIVSRFGLGAFADAWIVWFLSNAWGILIVVPLVSEWGRIRKFFTRAVPQAWIELLVIAGFLSVIAFLIWTRSVSVGTYTFVAPFLIFPLLVWIALRFGVAGATVGSFFVSVLVLITTAHGLGRFAFGYQSLHTRFVELQVFMTIATICSLVAAVIMADRERAEVSLCYASSILESTDAAVIGKTLDGIITSWNPGAERLYGYAATEVIGHPISILMPDDQANEMPEILERVRRSEKIAEYETVRQRKDGTRIHVSLTISPIYDKNGVLVGASSIGRDITRQMRAERILEQTRERLELSFDAAQMGAWDWDFRNDSLEWVGNQESLFGFAPGAFDNRGETALARIHPDDSARVRNEIAGWIAQGQSEYEQEFRVVWPDGSQHWLFAKGRIIYEDGNAIRCLGINFDITERKQAEQALRDSEERFRNLADNMSQFAWMADAKGCLFWYNQRWYDFTGTTFEQMQGWGWQKVHHPDHLQRVVDKFTRCLETGEPWEDTFPLRGKDGNYRWFLSRALPIRDAEGNIVRWFGTNTDITEQRNAEHALRKSEERLSLVVRAADLGTWDWNIRSNELVWSERCFALYGIPLHGSIDYERFLDAIHPQDRKRVDEAVKSAITRHEEYDVEMRSVWPDGTVHWITSRGRAYYDEAGEPVRMSGVAMDVSGRKQAEQAFRKSEQRFRTLTEALPQLVWTADAAGEIDYVNRRWCAYTGQTRQQALGASSFNVIHPDDLVSVQQAWVNAVRTGTQHQAEFRLRSKDGQYRWFLARGVPLRNEEGQAERWFGTCTDIHEMKMAQQALIRSEKLASVGRMAMTIAHEINNPLAAVMNTLFLTRSEPGMPKPALNYLDLADNELRRISHITRQALGFYRESTTPQRTSIGELLDSVTELLGGKLKAKRAEVRKEFEHDVEITAVSGELRQVFSNLLSNAIDAVEENGRIRLRISSSRDARDRRTVRISVADNGHGINPLALPHIFEPFFTTKDAVGTGLGLWVSKQIIDKHQGCIRVRSCPEGPRHGTVFSVILPMEAEAAECPSRPIAMAG